MIIAKLIGGLGNQLFQYAAARRLAEIHRTQLKLDISSFLNAKDRYYCLNRFNISGEVASYSELLSIATKRSSLLSSVSKFFDWSTIQLIKENHFQFDPAVLDAPDNIYLDGYWQSEKYFKDIEDIVRQEFIVKSLPDDENRKIAELIATSSSVSIHIRRGDFVSKPKTNQYHGTCTLDYYLSAINKLALEVANPAFFIFSDDMGWVRDNLKIGYPTTLVCHNSLENGFEDMRLMSLCKHHIIANSTFSWWGAWLSTNMDKIVYAPKSWFASSGNDTSDLLPESWRKI